jgi:hypothetical protein
MDEKNKFGVETRSSKRTLRSHKKSKKTVLNRGLPESKRKRHNKRLIVNDDDEEDIVPFMDDDNNNNLQMIQEEQEEQEESESESVRPLNNIRLRKLHKYLLVSSKHVKFTSENYNNPDIGITPMNFNLNPVEFQSDYILNSGKYTLSCLENIENSSSIPLIYETNRVERAARHFGKMILRELRELQKDDLQKFKNYVEKDDEVYFGKEIYKISKLKEDVVVLVRGDNEIEKEYDEIMYHDTFVQFVRIPENTKKMKIPTNERQFKNDYFQFFEYRVFEKQQDVKIWNRKNNNDTFQINNRYTVKSYFRPFSVSFIGFHKTIYGYHAIDVFKRMSEFPENPDTEIQIDELKRELFLRNNDNKFKHTIDSENNNNKLVRDLNFGQEDYDKREPIRNKNCIKKSIQWKTTEEPREELLKIKIYTSKESNKDYVLSKLKSTSLSFFEKLKKSFRKMNTIEFTLPFVEKYVNPFVMSQYYKIVTHYSEKRENMLELLEKLTRIQEIQKEQMSNNSEVLKLLKENRRSYRNQISNLRGENLQKRIEIQEIINTIHDLVVNIVDNNNLSNDFTTKKGKFIFDYSVDTVNDKSDFCTDTDENINNPAYQYRSYNELKKFMKRDMSNKMTFNEWTEYTHTLKNRDLILKRLSLQLLLTFILFKKVKNIITSNVCIYSIYEFIRQIINSFNDNIDINVILKNHNMKKFMKLFLKNIRTTIRFKKDRVYVTNKKSIIFNITRENKMQYIVR